MYEFRKDTSVQDEIFLTIILDLGENEDKDIFRIIELKVHLIF